jgi:hypothetical protein
MMYIYNLFILKDLLFKNIIPWLNPIPSEYMMDYFYVIDFYLEMNLIPKVFYGMILSGFINKIIYIMKIKNIW